MRTQSLLLLTLFAFAPLAKGAGSNDAQNSVMEVRSGRDLAMAFAASAHLDVALVLSDVWMEERDWYDIVNGSGPLLIKKNFMILGSPSLPDWPLLNMGFIHGKIRIGNGVTITIRHVVVGDFRSDLLTQAPGFDLAAPTLPGGAPGVLLHNETAVTYSVCLPKHIWSNGINTSTRATTRPGTHTFTLSVPQVGCINVTAAVATPPLYPPKRGLVLQPRLPARCWADRGVFLDLAVPGADVSSVPATVPNNYDVLLSNVTYLCARTITLECLGLLRDPYACALSMIQNDTARMPWRMPDGPDARMSVNTGRDLAVGLAASPLVTQLRVEQDIWLSQSDWDGLLGGVDGAEPALISRNVTVEGSPSLGGAWPLLNMGFVHDKIRIGSGASLTVRHLLLGDFRNEIPTQGPGLDLAAATQLGMFDTQPGLLYINESALLYGLCFPVPTWTQSLMSAPRASSSPGAQAYKLGMPQDDCANTTTSAPRNGNSVSKSSVSSLPSPASPPTPVAPGGGDDVTAEAAAAAAAAATSAAGNSGLLLQPPLLSRCWASRGIFINVGLRGADVDRYENQAPTSYDVLLRNVTYLCANVMTSQCLTDRGGALGCMTWLSQQMTSQALPWRKSSSAPPPVEPEQPESGGGDKNKVVLGAAIGGAVGGVALLALLAVAVLAVVRRRKKQARDGGMPEFNGMDGRSGGNAVEANGAEGAMMWRSGSGRSRCFPIPSGAFRRTPNGTVGGAAAEAEAASAKNAGSADAGTTGSGAIGDAGGGNGTGSGTPTASNIHSAGDEDSGEGGVLASREEAVKGMAAVESIGGASGQGTRSGDVRGPAAIPSSSDHMVDPLTRSGGDGSSGLSLQRPPTSAVKLLPEDEHVVVTPLTPPRADLALGEAAAQEVTLLPVVRGKGAFGRVYEGMYGGEKVAVKVMRDVGDLGAGGGGSLDHVRNSFAQEVEVLGRCQHPNVVRLLAACLTPPKLLLVMELMETSLEKLVYSKTGGLLPLRTVLYIALDIAKGLEYLHPTVLHRDLKPGNVLINGPNSPRPVAKITDFGVSRLRSTVLITKHPEAGTPAYMAPETFDVKNYTLTHHVDIYSFGVLLWVLLTGEHPWKGFQMVEVAYKVTINREKLPTARIPPGRCPIRLRALMDQCWEYEPRRRPAAAEVVKELQGLLDVMP